MPRKHPYWWRMIKLTFDKKSEQSIVLMSHDISHYCESIKFTTSFFMNMFYYIIKFMFPVNDYY